MPSMRKYIRNKLSCLLRAILSMSSEDYVSELRQKGIQIGDKTKFFDAASIIVDTTRPWMLKIGNYCKITHGVVILAHDYSRSVLRRSHNAILAEGKNTVIGDNVFIGFNSIILAGSNIGNNVIIGAGSVVSGKIPDNVVIAGNPARIIRTMEEHYAIRKKHNLEEAQNCCRMYYENKGHFPSIKEMGHFFPLYLHSEKELEDSGIDLNWSGDEAPEILQSFLTSEHPYKSYSDFLAGIQEP